MIFYTLTILSVLDAARKLNAEMKMLICEQDDLPTPVLGSPVDDHVTTSEEMKVKEETTPESTGGRSVYTKTCIVDHCLSFFFRPLYCLSFNLWILIPPWVSLNPNNLFIFCCFSLVHISKEGPS